MDIAQAPYMRAAALDPAGLDAAIQDLGRKKPQSVVPADQLVQDANALLARRSISSRVRLGGTLPTDTTPPRFKKRMVFAATGGWIVKVMRLRVINLMTVSIQKPVSTQ